MARSDPSILLPWLDGEPARAAREAARLLADDGLDEARAPRLHPSWLTAPLHRFPVDARPGLLLLTPPRLARLAALALEREQDGVLDTRAAIMPRAASARTLMRAAATIPSGVDPGDAPEWLRADPFGFADVLSLPEDDVFSRWPDDARRILASARRTLPACKEAHARAFVTLAACLVGRIGQARGVASLMAHDVGSTLLASVNRWWFVLDPADAESLHDKLDGGLSWAG